jgi:hypothetical protein
MIRAEDFWRCFRVQVVARRPAGFGAEWTQGMYDVLHAVQQDLNLWCQCKPGHAPSQGDKGELLKIDMMWFERPGRQWDPPLVAIEHENAWSLHAALVDFWRVSQICAPLRVCIAYVRSASGVDEAANTLLSTAVAHGWKRLPGAEDLLVLGHGDMDSGGFRAWRLDATGSIELTT